MFGFSQLGPIEINCDAPSYKIVEACRKIGLETPEDVRWCRRSQFVHTAARWKGFFSADSWKRLLGRAPDDAKKCSCGARLPSLDRVTFTFTTGTEAIYLLGQCLRCRTIFWDEA
jgi:hypothetical protein